MEIDHAKESILSTTSPTSRTIACLKGAGKCAASKFFSSLTVVLCLASCLTCTSSSSNPAANNPSPTTGSTTVALDSAGIVQTTIAVVGPDSSELTLYAGTQIMLITDEADPIAPVAGSDVRLRLADANAGTITLPEGITSLVQFRIVLTVAGSEVSAEFWSPVSDTSIDSLTGARDEGLKLAIQIDSGTISDGTMGLLYHVSASGTPVLVGTSGIAGTSSPALSKGGNRTIVTAAGRATMAFNPNSTGSYATGGSAPGDGPVSIPTGTYWCTYAVSGPPGGCMTIAGGAAQYCGSSRVQWITVCEWPTEEELALCDFSNGDVAASHIVPPGYQFWAERSYDSASDITTIQLHSTHANLPTIHVNSQLTTADGDHVGWTNYLDPTGGVHAPDGTVYADPYNEPSLKFAGAKKFMFYTSTTKDYAFWKRTVERPLQDSGYSAYIRRTGPNASGGSFAEVYVDTFAARVLISRRVIEKNGWKVRTGERATKGNLGSFDYVGKLKIITPFGISVIHEYPQGDETSVEGTITIMRDTIPIYNATVTVNGTPVSAASDGYDLGNAGISINPGDSIYIRATIPDDALAESISVKCPNLFEITSPADGSINTGAPLDVSWSPAIAVVPTFTFVPAPIAGQYACGSTQGTYSRLGTGSQFVNLAVGQTRATLTDVSTGCDFSIVEVRASSEAVLSANGSVAICYLHRRIRQIGN
jgi:hypothetical protein